MQIAARRRNQLHAVRDVRQVTVLVEQLVSLLLVELLAGDFVGELQAGDDLHAVQLPIDDGRREPVHILRIPASPQCRLAVPVDQIPVVPHDVPDDFVVERRDALFLLRRLRHARPQRRVAEGVVGKLVAARRRLPLPVFVRRHAPAFPIGILEATPLEGPGRKTFQPIDRFQPLQRLKGFPRIRARLRVTRRAEAERLARHVIRAPRTVVVRVDHARARNISGPREP